MFRLQNNENMKCLVVGFCIEKQLINKANRPIWGNGYDFLNQHQNCLS